MKFLTWLTKGATIAIMVVTLTSCAKDDSYTTGFGTPQKLEQYSEAGNLWRVLGDNFDLPDESENNPAVAWQIKWFMQNPIYLKRMAENAAPFLYYIYQQVKKRHLPAELALLPMVESAYDPFATNYGSGAAGLWQMIPGTASGFGLRLDWWYDGRRDVIASTNAALNYFVFLGKFFDNQWLLAIAAYDSGEGTVENAIHHNAKIGRPTSFWYLTLPYETETYVPKLLALAAIIKHPDKYPVNLPVVKNSPYLASVDIGSQIDLAHAAKMAGMSLGALAMLNPGYNRWATDPNGPHKLVLPITHAARFEKALKQLPRSKRVSWHRIVVKPGYVLNKIADTYNTSVYLIKQINHLKTNTLKPGQVLLIPTSNDTLTQIVNEKEHNFIMRNQHVRLLKITRHTVKPGETIWSIAKKYHVKSREIRFWNSLKNNEVQPGTSLIIWPPHTKHNQSYWQPTYHLYKVKPGDSLWPIALKFHISIKVISQLNHIKNNVIKPGQVLRIPVAHEYVSVPHTERTTRHKKNKQHKKALDQNTQRKIITYKVKSGDYIYKIANKFHMPHKTFLQLNKLTRKSKLHIGQTVKVYQ